MHDPLHVCANYRREGIASIMPSPGRRKNTATAVEVQHLLKAGLPEGLGKGVTFPSENEVFCEQKELLLRELLLTTPRVTAKLVSAACLLAFQDADSNVVQNFTVRCVASCQFLYNKKNQSSSGKKLPPAIRRLVTVLKPAAGRAVALPVKAKQMGKFTSKNCAARALRKHHSEQSEQAAAAAGSSRDHELKALADSYGLTSVPAAALGPCLVSESDDDESSGCVVVSEAEVEAEDEQVSAEPASSSAKPAASRVAPVSRASGKQSSEIARELRPQQVLLGSTRARKSGGSFHETGPQRLHDGYIQR